MCGAGNAWIAEGDHLAGDLSSDYMEERTANVQCEGVVSARPRFRRQRLWHEVSCPPKKAHPLAISPNLAFDYRFFVQKGQGARSVNRSVDVAWVRSLPPDASLEHPCWAAAGNGQASFGRHDGLAGPTPHFELFAGWSALLTTEGWTHLLPSHCRDAARCAAFPVEFTPRAVHARGLLDPNGQGVDH